MRNEYIIENIINRALEEDMPFGDITTDNIISEEAVSEASFIAKEAGIIAGIEVSKMVFKILDDSIIFESKIKDGDEVSPGTLIAVVKGKTRCLLKAERTALNLLQRLSGIATKTRAYCEKVKAYSVKIVDTRKTTPGLRILEKYAVKVGGGHNHRYCLSDAVMIKDNHIKAAGGIKEAILLARNSVPHTTKIEVETETIQQVEEALEACADIIMLDNMSTSEMKKAVAFVDKRAIVEASGNMSMENIGEVASLGVDIISVGALTHSVNALDISLRII